MSFRSVLIRVAAVALVALGWIGMQNNLFRRSYSMRFSATIQKATPQDLDTLFDELRKTSLSTQRIAESKADILTIVVNGETWNETNDIMSDARRTINRVVSAKKLAMISSSSSGGYSNPGSRAIRFRFIGFAMLSLLGLAVFVLSLRLLGGGPAQIEEGGEGHSV
jgi:hypothetical protein